MPKRVIRLTDMQVRNVKPKDSDYKVFDGEGLFLLVKSTGGKLWRLKYRFFEKEKLLALGKYPEVDLHKARKRAEEARALVADGVDPGVEKKAVKAAREEYAANTFEAVAREWCEKQKRQWTEKYGFEVMSCLERDVFPAIGKKPILEITPPEMLRVLRKIENRGTLVALRKTKQICGRVFCYAVACGKADRDPTADLKGAIATPKVKHFASITEPKALGELLRAINGYEGGEVTRCALLLATLVFVRPGELQKAEWSEFDFEENLWTIPAAKMKMRRPHLVPLSRQSLKILSELKKITGEGKYLLPSLRGKSQPMSNNTMNAALRRLGYTKEQVTAHGFRSTASTLLHEMGWPTDAIERQLAHVEQNKIKGAYNKALHLPERRKMMQAWADYLDGLREGAKVIPFKRDIG